MLSKQIHVFIRKTHFCDFKFNTSTDYFYSQWPVQLDAEYFATHVILLQQTNKNYGKFLQVSTIFRRKSMFGSSFPPSGKYVQWFKYIYAYQLIKITFTHFLSPMSSFCFLVQDTKILDQVPWSTAQMIIECWNTHDIKSWENRVCLFSRREETQEEILLLSAIAGEYREDGARLFLEEHSSMKRGNRHTLQGMVFYQSWRSSFQPRLFPNTCNLTVFRTK